MGAAKPRRPNLQISTFLIRDLTTKDFDSTTPRTPEGPGSLEKPEFSSSVDVGGGSHVHAGPLRLLGETVLGECRVEVLFSSTTACRRKLAARRSRLTRFTGAGRYARRSARQALSDRDHPWVCKDADTADLVLVLGTNLGGLNADQIATECASRSPPGPDPLPQTAPSLH